VPTTVDFVQRLGHVIVVDRQYDRLRRTLDEIDAAVVIR
jgi:hypothetical protein